MLYAHVLRTILWLAFGHFTVFCIFYIALSKVKTRLGNSQLQPVGMTAKVKFVICLCNQFPVPACHDSAPGLFILFHSADIRRKNGVRKISCVIYCFVMRCLGFHQSISQLSAKMLHVALMDIHESFVFQHFTCRFSIFIYVFARPWSCFCRITMVRKLDDYFSMSLSLGMQPISWRRFVGK